MSQYEPHQQPAEQHDTDQPDTQTFDRTGPVLPPAAPATAPARTRGPRRGRLVAGVATLALLAGAGGGVAGGAIWDAASDDVARPTAGTPVSQGSQASTRPAPVAPDGSIEAVADIVLPSVVQINVAGQQGSGSGSGIILDEDGLILTNNHVVEVAEGDGDIVVSFNDGTTAPAEVLGTDPLTDTAVIRAQGVSDLTPIEMGDSDALRVGQQVVAVGSPFGLDSTVTSGIVSALDRPVNVGSPDDQGNSTTYPAIQTDAAINPGNSGGPLVDLDGRLVGINSSIRSAATGTGQAGSIGLGFAIPIGEVMAIVEQMAAGETPTHARLGVSVTDVSAVRLPGYQAAPGTPEVDPDELPATGALVQLVADEAAAGGVGLEAGDVITRVDDTLISGSDSLVATIRSYRPGDQVQVTWVRDGEEQTETLELGSDAEGQG
jgi:putative serine protease PepD